MSGLLEKDESDWLVMSAVDKETSVNMNTRYLYFL